MAKPTGTIRAYLHTVVYYAFKAHLWASKFMPQDTLERGKKKRKEKKKTDPTRNKLLYRLPVPKHYPVCTISAL